MYINEIATYNMTLKMQEKESKEMNKRLSKCHNYQSPSFIMMYNVCKNSVLEINFQGTRYHHAHVNRWSSPTTIRESKKNENYTYKIKRIQMDKLNKEEMLSLFEVTKY